MFQTKTQNLNKIGKEHENFCSCDVIMNYGLNLSCI